MHEKEFSCWVKWIERRKLLKSNCPGVYAIALSDQDLDGIPFTWKREIVYVGMTNSHTGLKGRLRKFDKTIAGGRGHGGADRFRYKHPNYRKSASHLYVAIARFPCDTRSGLPNDLRVLGEVARFEYFCLAEFAERFNRLPEFNDKKKSPKDSKMVRPRSNSSPGLPGKPNRR